MASVFSFVLNTFAAAFLVLDGNGLPSGVYVSHRTSKLPDPGLNGSGYVWTGLITTSESSPGACDYNNYNNLLVNIIV